MVDFLALRSCVSSITTNMYMRLLGMTSTGLWDYGSRELHDAAIVRSDLANGVQSEIQRG